VETIFSGFSGRFRNGSYMRKETEQETNEVKKMLNEN
jgi:hypothetical protein